MQVKIWQKIAKLYLLFKEDWHEKETKIYMYLK